MLKEVLHFYVEAIPMYTVSKRGVAFDNAMNGTVCRSDWRYV